MAEVQITPAAAEDIQGLPPGIKPRVRDVLARLEKWPHVSGVKPLRYELKGAYRIRTGDYRIVLTIKAGLVVVIRGDNRRDVYER
jgi:mRNA interferase RelE/StbE